MSDGMKYVIRNYIPVQLVAFWVSFVKGWAIFYLFSPTDPSVLQNESKYVF